MEMQGAQQLQPAGGTQTRNEFADFINDFKAKRAAKLAASRPAAAPAPAPVEVFDIEVARAELARLEAVHDSSYQFTEDRAAYSRGSSQAATITALRDRIARAEKAAAQASNSSGGAQQ